MLAEWRQEALQGLRGPTHQPAKPKKDQRDTLIQQLEQGPGLYASALALVAGSKYRVDLSLA